jgi:hypothetical protein
MTWTLPEIPEAEATPLVRQLVEIIRSLRVLERPEVPLHNNLSEGHMRDYVKKRKISGSTRSESGRGARDTFASLKKTCRRLGVNFWAYLLDRLRDHGWIPPLAELIRRKGQEMRPGKGSAMLG